MLRQTWIYVPQVMLTHTWLQSTLLFPSEVRTVFCTNRYLKMCHKFVFYVVQSCANVDMRNYVMFVQTENQHVLGWRRGRHDLAHAQICVCLLFHLDCIWWVLKQVPRAGAPAWMVLTQQAKALDPPPGDLPHKLCVAQACDSSTLEIRARWTEVQGPHWLHRMLKCSQGYTRL